MVFHERAQNFVLWFCSMSCAVRKNFIFRTLWKYILFSFYFNIFSEFIKIYVRNLWNVNFISYGPSNILRIYSYEKYE